MLIEAVNHKNYILIAIGVSAGGMKALSTLLPSLPGDYSIPLVVVQHLHPDSGNGYLAEYLDRHCRLKVKEADEKESIAPGNVYIAPADYHLLVERDRTFSLSKDPKVNYSRPSIDVLFETAAEACGPGLIGIVLTGASADGAKGLLAVKRNGGLTIVQDPDSAESKIMPQAAVALCGKVDHLLSLEEIAGLLISLSSTA